jgi:hypothetical protein
VDEERAIDRVDRRLRPGLVPVPGPGPCPAPWAVWMLGSTGMDIGRDALSALVYGYEGPNSFTGTIERTVAARGRRNAADVDATAQTEMARG